MSHPEREYKNRILSLLRSGTLTSREIRDRIGVSQPTVSRLITSLAGEVLTLGRGRSTRYALPREVRGAGYEFPLYRVTETGDVARVGVLLSLQGGEYWWNPADGSGELFDHIPWFIQDLRPSGYMGRAFAHKHSTQVNLPNRLQDWTDDHMLVAISLRGEDLMGNLIVGEESLARYIEAAKYPTNEISDDERLTQYPQLVKAAIEGDPPGSSAGGEQPKFAVKINETGLIRNVMVKFSPPLQSPEGRRWADLLVCEHIALEVIGRRGIPASRSSLVEAGGRQLLEVERFDRLGKLGRLPMTSLMAIDLELFGKLDNWVAAANRLEDNNMLSKEDADNLRWLSVFGQLVANTDQHFGNVSLIMVDDRRKFTLAPAYDMLPMLYAPRGNELFAPTFAPRPPAHARAIDQWEDALKWATIYWKQTAGDERISDRFRVICGDNVETLKTLIAGPKLL